MSVPDSTPAPSLADAGAATRALFEAPDNPVTDVGTPPVDAPSTTTDTTAPEGTEPADTPTPLSWDSIDLSVLPEDAQKVIRDGYLRHSDYTRKTQELADQRKQYEQYGDPETVQAALELANSLQDPANLRQLKAEIEEYLTQNNLNESTAPPAQAAAPTTDPASPGLDPAIHRDLEELKSWRAEQEHQKQEAALVDQMTQKLQTAEDAIRADYPSYTQSDIDAIYKLSPATGYDLLEAQQQYEGLRKHFTESLIGNKGQIPPQAGNVHSDAPIQQPFDMTDFKSAKEATAALFAAEE